MSDIERQLRTLHLIASDMEADVKAMDGKPFDGRAVATALGQIMAATQALANVVAKHIEASS